jgi:sugar/nucleoside kinase (ribokinase family)
MLLNSVNPGVAPKIIGIGAATLDRSLLVKKFTTDEVVELIEVVEESLGGPVAVACSFLGMMNQRVAMVDTMGYDYASEYVREKLRDYQVDIEECREFEGEKTAQATLLVNIEDGRRQIYFEPSTAPEPEMSEELKLALKNCKLVHVNGRHERLCMKVLEQISHTDVILSFDGGAGRYRPSLIPLIKRSQWLIVSEEFGFQYTKIKDPQEMAKQMIGAETRIIVITQGLRGSWIFEIRDWQVVQQFHCKAYVQEQVVDTTGCGDIYHGAFIYGYLQGWKLMRVARYASAMAGVNARGLGASWILNGISKAHDEALHYANEFGKSH